jgi:nucleotide-binding universal stress UspA family protein
MQFMSKLVTFATQTKDRAEVIKSELEKEGLSCFIEEIETSDNEQENVVKVRVKQQEYELALDVARRINKAYGREEIKIPREPFSIDKVLIPVVFKDYSINAVYYALEIAIKEHADIMLFHSYFNPFNNVTAYSEEYNSAGYFDVNVHKIEEYANSKIEGIVNDLRNKVSDAGAEINVDYELTGGAIYDQMISFSKKYNPDLVVIGTKGKGKKNNDLIGKFTDRVIDNITAPVLAVPEDTTFSTVDNLKVLYLTRFDDTDYTALRNLMTYMEPFNPYIHCVHMEKNIDNPTLEDRMMKIVDFFKKHYNQSNIEYEIMKGDAMLAALQEYINDKQISMISLSYHKKFNITRLFESDIKKKLLFYTNIPLLVFHS